MKYSIAPQATSRLAGISPGRHSIRFDDSFLEILAVEGTEFTFRPKATQPLYETAALTRQLETRFGVREVDCGDRSVLVKRTGDIINCTSTAGGREQPLNLRVANAKGELEPVT